MASRDDLIEALGDDFGAGAVPLVTYTTLPQFIYGAASTATATFAVADSQPYNFLNLDFYAQDTWKVTRTLTWTFGIRDTYNSNPVNPHRALARLSGSFDSIPHDVNQPLSQPPPAASMSHQPHGESGGKANRKVYSISRAVPIAPSRTSSPNHTTLGS